MNTTKQRTAAIPSAIPPERPPFEPGGDKGLKLKPTTAAAGDVPRFVSEYDRAPAGLKRYKVRGVPDALSTDPLYVHFQPPRAQYILAETEEQAAKLYSETVTLPPGCKAKAWPLKD